MRRTGVSPVQPAPPKAQDEQGHEFILVDALKTADGMVKRSTDK